MRIPGNKRATFARQGIISAKPAPTITTITITTATTTFLLLILILPPLPAIAWFTSIDD